MNIWQEFIRLEALRDRVERNDQEIRFLRKLLWELFREGSHD